MIDSNNPSMLEQDEMVIAPYTEFFSWGSDSYGQLALANTDDDDDNPDYCSSAYYDEPRSLSFDIIIK